MTTVDPRELGASVAATRDRLRKSGVKPGDRIAILAPNSLEQFIFLLSLWQLKAIACPMNLYQPRSVIRAQMSHINACMLVDAKRLKYLVVRRNPAPSSLSNITLNQPVTILFTSGSSAQPKAAMHTFGNYYHHALASNREVPLKLGDCWLLSLPLYHVGGISILFRCWVAGAMVSIPRDKDEAMRCLSKERITHVSLVPTQLYRLLERRIKLPSIKCMLVGGAPIPPELIQRAGARGYPIYATYGLTETTSQVATSRPGSAGAKVLSCISVKVSQAGEILVKGKSLFQGYLKGRRAHLPLTRDGWFNTGDLGQMKKGRLFVTGRRDNQFISGGENIQPEEIERELLGIDGIAQAVVLARGDIQFGKRPVAVVQFRGRPLRRRRLEIALAKKLARFKIPDEFYLWPAVDSGSIKALRRKFQEAMDSGGTMRRIT